jgi:squalene-hopene/tetraprenyl-beta-curcumene cyclase
VRPDGSWPIDSNLSLWVTTLSINALATAGELPRLDKPTDLREWLLSGQFKERHPYTGAAAGGWGWTHLPGSVPDADDTAGALLALDHLAEPVDCASKGERAPSQDNAANLGLGWLASLQNSDGGLPTFCRGWGYLPFDRSGADLTAHGIRACAAWLRGARCRLARTVQKSAARAIDRGLHYLAGAQREDGAWLPLWFGNQYAPDDENGTYGTARVLAAYRDLDRMNTEPARSGIAWLLAAQNPDGGWGSGDGTPSSIEETALAVEILVDAGAVATESVNKGLTWIIQEVEAGNLQNPIPIGFYFAKLWYFEKLYPLIFTVAALGRAYRSLPGRREVAVLECDPEG